MHELRGARALPRWLWPSDWWDAFVASDPDYDRLRAGARAALATAASVALLAAFADWAGQPMAVVMIGAMVGMMATLAVQDPDERARRVTTALLPLPAAASALVAAALPAASLAGALAQLAVIFAAVSARRFGPRASALGLLGFFAHFNASFFGATLAQAPYMVAALAVGTAVTFVVRFVVIAEPARPSPAGALGAYRRRVAMLLARLADAVAAGRPPPLPAVRRAVRRLNEAAVGLEAKLAPGDRRPFDVELDVARLLAVVRGPAGRSLSPIERRAAADALLAARAALRRPPATGANAPSSPRAFERVDVLGREFTSALRALVDADLWRASARTATVAPVAPAPPPPAAPPRAPGTLSPATRQAIQATAACALAMALGRAISAERWQWAVIAAFVVFTRTTTRGDTIARAWERVLGTVAGVALGLAVAHAAHGHRDVELALVFLFLFLAMYLVRISQAATVAAVGALLALLYDLMGRFSPGLLYLRLAETLAGAGAGALVATLLLPERTTARVHAACAALLRDAAAYLRAASAEPPTPPAELGRAARGLDAKLGELLAAAEPLTQAPWRVNPAASRLVQDAGLLVFSARQLAAEPDAADPPDEARLAARVVGERLAARAGALADLLEGDGAPPPPDSLRAAALAPAGPRLTALHWLERIDEVLASVDRAARHLPPAAARP